MIIMQNEKPSQDTKWLAKLKLQEYKEPLWAHRLTLLGKGTNHITQLSTLSINHPFLAK